MSVAITLDMLRSASSDDFPVIDLGPYLRGESGVPSRVAGQFRYALERIGFLIVNHDIAPDLTAFFYTPHIDRPIECLPTCSGPGNPPKYPPITYGEYRVWWLNTNYCANIDPRRLRAGGLIAG